MNSREWHLTREIGRLRTVFGNRHLLRLFGSGRGGLLWATSPGRCNLGGSFALVILRIGLLGSSLGRSGTLLGRSAIIAVGSRLAATLLAGGLRLRGFVLVPAGGGRGRRRILVDVVSFEEALIPLRTVLRQNE